MTKLPTATEAARLAALLGESDESSNTELNEIAADIWIAIGAGKTFAAVYYTWVVSDGGIQSLRALGYKVSKTKWDRNYTQLLIEW